MKSVKKRIFWLAIFVAVFAVSVFGLTFSRRTDAVTPEGIFSSVIGAEVEYGKVANVTTITRRIKRDAENQTLSDQTFEETFDVADGRKGVKLTVDNDSKIVFNGNKGIFDLRFKGVSAVGKRTITSKPEAYDTDEVEQVDLTTIRFDFVSASNPADSFYIRFDQTEEGILHNYITVRAYYRDVVNTYILYHPSSNTVDFYTVLNYEISGNDYLNQGKILGIIFNPFDMTVSYANGDNTQLIVDLDDPSSMKKNFATRDIIGRIDEYSVTMTAIVTGENAAVMLYEFNGIDLGGEKSSPIENAEGPIIDTRINDVNGVAGYSYDLNLSEIRMYDAVDGYTAFNGDVLITDPYGNAVPHNGGVFIPTDAGVYTVLLTPKDGDDNVGESYALTLNVLAEYPVTEFDLHYGISDSLVNAGKVKFPAASISFALQGKYDGKVTVGAKISSGGNLIKDVKDASEDFTVDISGYSAVTVRYYVIDGLNNESVSRSYTVNNNGAAIDAKSVSTVYVIGDYVYANDVAGTVGHEIISPSGNVSSYVKVRVNEIGLWSVNYYYEKDGKTYTYTQYFDGVESPSDLFVTERGMTLENGVATPDYFGHKETGLSAVATVAYASATYKNLINVGKYTKDDTLFKFYPTPIAAGSNEIKQVTVKLSDVQDGANDITVEFFLHPFYEYHSLGVRVLVNGCLIAPEPSFRQYNFTAYLGYSSLHGKIVSEKGRVFPNNPIGLTLDYQTKTLYLFNDYEYCGVKLDDPDTIGKGNEWKGFSGNETRLSYIYSMIGQTAYSLILAVDGIDLSGDLIQDRTAPGIAVDYDEKHVPAAIVGRKFPIMNAYGMDSVDGRINGVKISVSQIKSGLSYIVPVAADKTFTPTEAGDYVITYTAVDRSGNIGQREIKISAFNSLEPLGLETDLDAVYPSSLSLGQGFAIASINGVGGSGKVTVSVCVKFNGEKIHTDGGFVAPEIEGDYTVVYTLTDYLGQTANIERTVNFTRSDDPILSAAFIPEAVMAGKRFDIPERTAVIYTATGKVGADVETYIDGVKVNGGYIPAQYDANNPAAFKGYFDLTYKVGEYEDTTRVKVLSANKDSEIPYLARYFGYGAGVSVITDGEQENYMPFGVTEDSSMFFANPLGAQELTLKFMLEGAKNGIGKINFVLRDKYNPAEKIVISTMKNPDANKKTGLIAVNGGTAVDFGGNYVQNTAQGIVLSLIGNRLYDVDGKLIATIAETESGEDFFGFTSEYVYLAIEFENVLSVSEFNLISINNQSFNVRAVTDRMAPVMVCFEDFVPTATINKPYTFVDIAFYDVLDSEVAAKLSIIGPSGDTIYSGDFIRAYTFTPAEYGEYNVTVEFKDSVIAKWAKNYRIINVADDRVPTITLKGDVPTLATKGSVVKLPEAVVGTDFVLYVYVSDPSGAITVVYKDDGYFGLDENKETYKFYEFTAAVSGTYKITYYAFGSGGNYSILTYRTTVK